MPPFHRKQGRTCTMDWFPVNTDAVPSGHGLSEVLREVGPLRRVGLLAHTRRKVRWRRLWRGGEGWGWPVLSSSLAKSGLRGPTNCASKQGNSRQAVLSGRVRRPARLRPCAQQAGSASAKSSANRATHCIPVLTADYQLHRMDANEGLRVLALPLLNDFVKVTLFTVSDTSRL